MGDKELLKKELKQFAEDNPKLDFTIITSRPEGMSYDLYKFLRSASNKAIKNYLKGHAKTN